MHELKFASGIYTGIYAASSAVASWFRLSVGKLFILSDNFVRPYSCHDTIIDMASRIHEQGNSLMVRWVPDHRGVMGNNIADTYGANQPGLPQEQSSRKGDQAVKELHMYPRIKPGRRALNLPMPMGKGWKTLWREAGIGRVGLPKGPFQAQEGDRVCDQEGLERTKKCIRKGSVG